MVMKEMLTTLTRANRNLKKGKAGKGQSEGVVSLRGSKGSVGKQL